jgi:hypothetical protein
MTQKSTNLFSKMQGILKKGTVAMLCAVSLIFLLIAGCNPPEPEPEPKPEPPIIEYPIEISFTEYSLAGSSCQWKNFNYDNKLIVINSNEELENYINCLEGNYPEIDFSKHTLLLVSGTTPNGIVEISNRLFQLSANEYKLDVEILLNEAEMLGYWITALIVNKLNEENDIELVTILKH